MDAATAAKALRSNAGPSQFSHQFTSQRHAHYIIFVRGGAVEKDSLASVGSGGSYWSQVGINSIGAYRLGFKNDDNNTPYGNSRFYAYSLRCVAIGS